MKHLLVRAWIQLCAKMWSPDLVDSVIAVAYYFYPAFAQLSGPEVSGHLAKNRYVCFYSLLDGPESWANAGYPESSLSALCVVYSGFYNSCNCNK